MPSCISGPASPRPQPQPQPWRSLTLTAVALAVLPVLAQAAPAEKLARPTQAERVELQRPNLQAVEPGIAKPGEHHVKRGVHPAELPLRRADDKLSHQLRIGEEPNREQALAQNPDARKAMRVMSARMSAAPMAAGASCTGTDFVGKSGSALISFIDAADLRGCMYTLYQGGAAQYKTVFSDANIITVSDELKRRAVNYPGNDSTKAMGLLSYLRTAGYWNYMSVAGDSRNGIPAGSAAMLAAAKGALVQLTQSPRFYDLTEDNGYFASEVFKTVPAGFAAAFATAAKRWVDQVQPDTVKVGYWTNETIVQAMNVFFQGSYMADFENLVRNDLSYASSLDAFLTRNASLAGTDNDYHLANAIGEMLRFLRFPTQMTQVRNMGINQLRRYTIDNDATIPVWLRGASLVDQYDIANCSAYGTCDGQAKIAQKKLPITHACSPQYTVRAQSMTTAQLNATCASINNQTGYFHGLMGTRADTPVANDTNAKLEIIVFNNYDQYSRFSGYMFGNSTNNGGIYLEGTPSQAGNQARFIAYRADWLADFEIWNLNHEFTHYLDGRYNMAGGFGDYPLENANGKSSSVWWIEGMAEYVSYSYRRAYNADATSRAQTAPLALSELFRNTYDSGQARVYNWGYLAARYMMERQPSQDQAFLPKFRAGNYAGYSQQIGQIGTSLDTDFANWLNQCVGGGDTTSANCVSRRAGTLPLLTAAAIGECKLGSANSLGNGCSRPLTTGGLMSYAISASGWSNTIFRLTDIVGEVDLYAKAGGWPSTTDYHAKGSGSAARHIELKVPTGGAGWIYVMAVPRNGFQKATLRGMYSALPFGTTPTTPDWTNGPVCTDSNANALGADGCVRKAQSSNGVNPLWYYVMMPPGKTVMNLRTGLGTGNADLYVRAGNWPSTATYHCKSAAAGNAESCSVPGIAPNTWVYVMVNGTFSGLAVSAKAQ